MVTAIQQRFFFAHYGLTNHDLETYLAAALSAGGDYADLYFEYAPDMPTPTIFLRDGFFMPRAPRR
jgi:hypothetical protein